MRTLFRAPFLAAAIVATACASDTPLATHAPDAAALGAGPQFGLQDGGPGTALATLRRVTARYHQIENALADGFVFLHPCEERPGEGPVGILYVHFERLMDGVIDPALPDALLYEPTHNGGERLVGVEFAVPYALWTEPTPPEFMGATFQPEDEFGVWALHIWLWRHNPEGMFAEANPNVSCGES